MTDKSWKTKLAARIHDPAEKALVLLRDPSGHEGGSVRSLCRELFGTDRIPAECEQAVKQADRWASAADRPQFPRDANRRYPAWAQVNFAEHPELKHPLTGQTYLDKEKFAIQPEHIKAASFDHFSSLIQRASNGVDCEKTLLAFWRFGPATPAKNLNVLWQLLPADTRIPDHTIWQHLDLSSAFAGAMAHGETPALLSVSIGPVQDFIAAARTTSDLWAGSHLLSTLAWQGMKVVCERLGPDALIFPQLRGVPIVDLWLAKEMGFDALFPQNADWKTGQTDNNPLFAAALPNKFMAIVPASQAERLATAIEKAVREWVLSEGRAMLTMLLKTIREPVDGKAHCFEQLAKQLEGFPEVHWAAVPWLEEEALTESLTAFYPPVLAGSPSKNGSRPGFLGSRAWKILKKEICLKDGWKFFTPNDGTLYPAVHDLAERLLAAAKSVRAFGQLEQRGYRDSLTGEAEWLTLDATQLERSAGQRGEALWTRVGREKPAWARKGEHLSALSMMKRLWPARFRDWLKNDMGLDTDIQRYVVSTHTMALARSLEALIRNGSADSDELQSLSKRVDSVENVALPRGLMRSVYDCADPVRAKIAHRLPALLDELREKEEISDDAADKEQARRTRQAVNAEIVSAMGQRPERYYALILMDGDNMGAWLAGNEAKYQLPFRDAWHSQVIEHIQSRGQDDASLQAYLNELRSASPARHMAISAALNGFALDLARHIVEDLHKGKLIYAGGDDVLAMVSIDDLLPCLWLLRLAYSGVMPEGAPKYFPDLDLAMKQGFVLWEKSNTDRRLYRVMGEKATASAGAVIAHHTTPLGAVLRKLRQAEKAAKSSGRNAFTLKVLKRAGGAVELTLPWSLATDLPFDASLSESPMGTLVDLQRTLAGELSRRAAYLSDTWLSRLPELTDAEQMQELLAANLAHQFKQQGANLNCRERANRLAKVAVTVAGGKCAARSVDVLRNMLAVAEFLAREGRSETEQAGQPQKEAAHG